MIFAKKYAILHKQIANRPYRLAVRTAPSHGANSGSSPDKVTTTATQQGGFFRGDLIGKDEEFGIRARVPKGAQTRRNRGPVEYIRSPILSEPTRI